MTGTGSLFLRTRRSHGKIERRWVATIRLPDGSRPSAACPHQHSPAEKRECAESKANLDQLKAIRDEQAPPDVRNLTVGDFLSRWVTMLDLAPATIRQHEMIVRVHLEPAFRRKPLANLKAADVDAYLRRKDLDPQTLRHHRATLRRALQDAVRDGYVDKNVASLSRAPRMRKAERRYLTAQEARRLIDTSRDDRLWPLWSLLVTTGLRLSEALGLAWSDIEGDTLHVRRKLLRVNGEWRTDEPKTAKSRRSVTLIPLALEALRVQKERQDAERNAPQPIDGMVFTTPSGQPIHGPNVLPPFYKALKRAGLPRLTLHDLRHSCATIQLAAGVPLPVIARNLGHSSIRVTADLYAHIVPELERDSARRLSEALG